ncbi:MAG: Undecaprenyl phosphate-alpha-4-amino-4-deoxy-L-arabinose arabinosyl transferase [Syntrophorhabdus sp. PtaU1.Bin153]|nr:MAG: Undecaprenyl phosphate-alpha-4-amino-4-deoxy-L-arabinose arabinosyl transferase [Syntrophorhabdus sp. PtaU1.Bin153]
MIRSIVVLCLVCSALFFVNLQSRDFWAPDEGDFAQITRELALDFIVPHLNGEPYAEKPPLFYYTLYASQKLFGSVRDEISLRLPSGLFALVGVVLFFVTIAKFVKLTQAFVSAGILATAPLYYWQARYVQVDMIFAIFVVASLLLFLLFYTTRRHSILYVSFLCLALAFMTKGPLAIALILPIAIAFLFSEKAMGIIKIRDICICILIFLTVVIPWYLAIYWREGAPYLYENIIRQNLTRFLDAWSHKRPFYYYFTTLPLDFFPWSLFLPLGIGLAFSRVKADPKTRYFLIWFLWMFLFLSLSSGKISKYILPALPAAAFMTSLAFMERDSRYNKAMLLILSFVFFALAGLLFIYQPGLYPEFYPVRIIIGVLSVTLTLALLFALRTTRMHWTFPVIFCFLVLCYLVGNFEVYGKWNRYKSPKPVGEKVASFVKEDRPWVYYGSIRGVYVYYAQRQAIHVDEHDTAGLEKIRGELNDFFILARRRDADEVFRTLSNVKLVFEETVGGTPMVFLHYEK